MRTVTSKRFNEFIKCKKIYCLLALRLRGPLRSRRGCLGGAPPRCPPRHSPPPPRRGWLSQGPDVTITAAIATARCRPGRRRLDAPMKLSVCGWLGNLLNSSRLGKQLNSSLWRGGRLYGAEGSQSRIPASIEHSMKLFCVSVCGRLWGRGVATPLAPLQPNTSS